MSGTLFVRILRYNTFKLP